MQEASVSAYIMFRSFLNAVGSKDAKCMERLLCEGGHQAALLGPVARAVATVAGTNAHGWLKRIDPHVQAESAVRYGISMKNCKPVYSGCTDNPFYFSTGFNQSDHSKYWHWLRQSFHHLQHFHS